MAFEMDNEMISLIDDAIEDASEKAMEEAEQYHVLSQDIESVVISAEREYKKAKKNKPSKGAELSVIFVSAESIEHLKYVQSMREFLKKEARKMVAELLAKREQGSKKRARGC